MKDGGGRTRCGCCQICDCASMKEKDCIEINYVL